MLDMASDVWQELSEGAHGTGADRAGHGRQSAGADDADHGRRLPHSHAQPLLPVHSTRGSEQTELTASALT